jgi:hypothetical protein
MVEFFATKIRYACQILSLYLSLSLVRSTDEGARKKEGRERGGEGFLGVLRLPSCLFYRFRVSSFLL